MSQNILTQFIKESNLIVIWHSIILLIDFEIVVLYLYLFFVLHNRRTKNLQFSLEPSLKQTIRYLV